MQSSVVFCSLCSASPDLGRFIVLHIGCIYRRACNKLLHFKKILQMVSIQTYTLVWVNTYHCVAIWKFRPNRRSCFWRFQSTGHCKWWKFSNKNALCVSSKLADVTNWLRLLHCRSSDRHKCEFNTPIVNAICKKKKKKEINI